MCEEMKKRLGEMVEEVKIVRAQLEDANKKVIQMNRDR